MQIQSFAISAGMILHTLGTRALMLCLKPFHSLERVKSANLPLKANSVSFEPYFDTGIFDKSICFFIVTLLPTQEESGSNDNLIHYVEFSNLHNATHSNLLL